MPAPLQILLVALVVTAAILDIRYRSIPNSLVVAGLIGAIAIRAWLLGWIGVRDGLFGAAVGFGVYLVLYMLRAMGGGDVKLMAAVGAVVGPTEWFVVFVFAAVLGGVIALISVIWKRALGRAARNVWVIVRELVRGRAPHKAKGELDIGHERALTLPHCVAIALGSLLFLWAQ